MKPWQINILIIIGVLTLFYLKVPNFVLWLIILASAIWVYIDAKKLEMGKYKPTFLGARGPISQALSVVLLWIITFPAYISYRQKIIDGKMPLREIK